MARNNTAHNQSMLELILGETTQATRDAAS